MNVNEPIRTCSEDVAEMEQRITRIMKVWPQNLLPELWAVEGQGMWEAGGWGGGGERGGGRTLILRSIRDQ